jgi:hypothetical protein
MEIGLHPSKDRTVLRKNEDRGQKTGNERKTRTNNPNRVLEIDPERGSHPKAETKLNR